MKEPVLKTNLVISHNFAVNRKVTINSLLLRRSFKDEHIHLTSTTLVDKFEQDFSNIQHELDCLMFDKEPRQQKILSMYHNDSGNDVFHEVSIESFCYHLTDHSMADSSANVSM